MSQGWFLREGEPASLEGMVEQAKMEGGIAVVPDELMIGKKGT